MSYFDLALFRFGPEFFTWATLGTYTCPPMSQLCFVLGDTDDPCLGLCSSQPRESSMNNLCSINDKEDFIRVIEFNYPFLEPRRNEKLTAQHSPAVLGECLLWREVCLACSESGFHVSSANTQRDCSSPHCQAHFKPCWVVSLNPGQWIPTIRSHKSILFWSHFHLSCFCHLHFYSLSHRWPGHHIAIFNNLALFLFELFFFKVGFSSFGRKIESFQFCPYLNLLCAYAPPTESRGMCSWWHSEWPCVDGELLLIALWWCYPLQDFE